MPIINYAIGSVVLSLAVVVIFAVVVKMKFFSKKKKETCADCKDCDCDK